MCRTYFTAMLRKCSSECYGQACFRLFCKTELQTVQLRHNKLSIVPGNTRCVSTITHLWVFLHYGQTYFGVWGHWCTPCDNSTTTLNQNHWTPTPQ